MVFCAHMRTVLYILCIIGPTVYLLSTKTCHPPPTFWENYTSPWRNRTFSYTVNREGYLSTSYGYAMRSGLGNQLFELLALIGIADKLNRIPYIKVEDEYTLQKVGDSIREFFPKIQRQISVVYWNIEENVVPFNGYGCCIYDDVERLKSETGEYLRLDGAYFQSYKYFDHRRSDVRNWLLPNNAVRHHVRKKLPSYLKDHFLICAHIRRGDFVTTSWKGPSDANFSVPALEYLMRKYSRANKLIGAVVLGSDIQWEKKTFGSLPWVHIMENSTPVEDLAFSRIFCDVVLITAPSSTFGFFLGYTSKRFDVYYRDILTTKDATKEEMDPNDFFPPTWNKIVEKGGQIIEVFNTPVR